MRTLEEANNLLFTYREELKRVGKDDCYVITADSMTVNKNMKNGRFEISKVDIPFIFSKSAAEWRRDREASKNTLLTFRVVRYKKWLEDKIDKLEAMVHASNVVQGDAPAQLIEEEEEVEEVTEPTVETDHVEIIEPEKKEEEVVEEKPENSVYNIAQIVNKKCPINSNNCLCCIYCKNIQLVNHMCCIECSYRAEE